MLKPVSRIDNRTNGMAVTADKYERLSLNAEVQKVLLNDDSKELFLYWDEEARVIGISKKPYDKSHTPYKFDKRGCSSASDFLRRCEIDSRDGAVKFIWNGWEGDVMLFRQVGMKKVQTFKQEKNGNLERAKN